MNKNKKKLESILGVNFEILWQVNKLNNKKFAAEYFAVIIRSKMKITIKDVENGINNRIESRIQVNYKLN